MTGRTDTDPGTQPPGTAVDAAAQSQNRARWDGGQMAKPKIPGWITSAPDVDGGLVARLWADLPTETQTELAGLSHPPSVIAGGWVAPTTGLDRTIPGSAHTGRYTGRGVYESQNRMYDDNAIGHRVIGPDGAFAVRRLTNVEIAIMWCMDFPRSRCNFMAHVDYIASTLTAYVNGKHADPTGNVSTHTDIRKTWANDGITVASRPVTGPVSPECIAGIPGAYVPPEPKPKPVPTSETA